MAGTGAGFGLSDEFALYRMMRPACENCGCRTLRWGLVRQLAFTLPVEQRKSLAEGLEFVDGDSDAVMWLCTKCDNLGIFGGFEASF